MLFRSAGLDVNEVTIDRLGLHQLQALRGNVVFPVLHGPWGEGGALQELLEQDGRPYVGCGPAAARLAMDKPASKRAVAEVGVPTPPARWCAKATPSRCRRRWCWRGGGFRLCRLLPVNPCCRNRRKYHPQNARSDNPSVKTWQSHVTQLSAKQAGPAARAGALYCAAGSGLSQLPACVTGHSKQNSRRHRALQFTQTNRLEHHHSTCINAQKHCYFPIFPIIPTTTYTAPVYSGHIGPLVVRQ